MKKYLALIMFVVCTANAMSQDTVREGDSWYMFKSHSDIDRVDSMRRGIYGIGSFIIQHYGSVPDTIAVYGVAYTVNRIPVEEDYLRESVTMTPTMALLNHDAHGNPPTVSLIDSTNVFGLLKQYKFAYQVTGNKDPEVVPCYEFYFDNPHYFVLPSDTFYVAGYWPVERYLAYDAWVRQLNAMGQSYYWMTTIDARMNQVTPNVEVWKGANSLGEDIIDGLAYNNGYLFTDSWGGLFPIVNLRCTAPGMRLVGHGGDSVTVGWWQAEGGEAYELSLGTYGSDPDTGLLVTPADSVHTFTGLQSDTLYSIWVRKACRYTTEGYDTLVWSDWSRPLVCRTSVGIGEVYDGEGLHVAAQDGCVAVQGLASGERAEVYDMKGCRVATLAADGRTAPLPQGVYLVRTTAGRARKAVLTR